MTMSSYSGDALSLGR